MKRTLFALLVILAFATPSASPGRPVPSFECRAVAGEIKCDAQFVYPHVPTWVSYSTIGDGQMGIQRERGIVVYFPESRGCQTVVMTLRGVGRVIGHVPGGYIPRAIVNAAGPCKASQ